MRLRGARILEWSAVKHCFDNNLQLFTQRGRIRNVVVYWLHYLEVRYATVRPSRSLLLFRRFDRLGPGPIWIGGIEFQFNFQFKFQFKFQRQRGQFSFVRIFRRVVLSFRWRVVWSLAFECGITLFRWRFEPCFAHEQCRVPCRPRWLNSFRQQRGQFGKRDFEAPRTGPCQGRRAAANNKTAQLVDALIHSQSPAAGTCENP